jgi:hypothetical protein
LIAGSVVLATIPDASGVIHGCYQRPEGSVRIIDDSETSCRPSESPVSWSVQGPRGLTGAPGPTGPSNAFLKDQRGSFSSQLINSPSFVNIVTLSLPAGSYVVNATAALVGGATFVTAQCAINRASGAGLSDDLQATLGGSANSFGVIPLTAAFTLTAADNVSLACRSNGNVSTQPSTIAAIQVATLTAQ